MNKVKNFPVLCPSCLGALTVTRLRCGHCETEVGGRYPLPRLSLLAPADQEFILQFVMFSGSLKEMAKLMGVSYPTVRNRLNAIIERLAQDPEPDSQND